MNEAPKSIVFADKVSSLPPGHKPVAYGRIGVLLLNLGTPDGTDYWAMRRYLKEFLSDERVIEEPRWKWWPILNLIILTVRPGRKGKDYATIWNNEKNESPIKTISRNQATLLAERLGACGCAEIGFGDTTGMANPRQVGEFYAEAVRRLGDRAELTAHFHNTRGQGLANALAALGEGVVSFESSFGELGGCPVPPGSTGNISSEDLVSMLHEMGIETGVDLNALLAASRAAQEVLGRPLGAHVLTAGPVEWGGGA